MITTETEPNWRLVRYYDVRPIDWVSGKRLDLPEEELPNCCRCDRKHAKVFVVTDGTRELAVGSGCCQQAFGGWEPSTNEIRKAKSAARKAEIAARDAIVADLIARIKAGRAAVVVPEPSRRVNEYGVIEFFATAPNGVEAVGFGGYASGDAFQRNEDNARRLFEASYRAIAAEPVKVPASLKPLLRSKGFSV